MYEHGKLGISVNTSPIMALLKSLFKKFLSKGLGPCLFGTLGLVFLMPPNIIGGKYVEKLQDQQLQEKDLRIKVYTTSIY